MITENITCDECKRPSELGCEWHGRGEKETLCGTCAYLKATGMLLDSFRIFCRRPDMKQSDENFRAAAEFAFKEATRRDFYRNSRMPTP